MIRDLGKVTEETKHVNPGSADNFGGQSSV